MTSGEPRSRDGAIRPLADAALMDVKNPVREHGASSMEKAIYTWGLIANGRRWSAPKTTWPFIPDRESGTGRLFHVTEPDFWKRCTREG
jgi:hypothetical protein